MIKKLLLLSGLFCFSILACASSVTRPPAWAQIKHVVIIVLENTRADVAVKQPFLRDLTLKGALLSHYFAVAHPSEPNYLALTGGSTFGLTDDSDINVNAKHIGNLLEAKGLSWKAYAEGYPGNCFTGSLNGNYARRHNPFISYMNVQNNRKRCNKIVPGEQFFKDIAANKLPTYSFYIPDVKNDGHDTGAEYADKWLSKTFGSYMNNAEVLKDTLFIVTFDEDDSFAGNNVYTVLVGAGAKPGVKSKVKYTHYSLLRTIEEIFAVGNLGRKDKSAAVISDIW